MAEKRKQYWVKIESGLVTDTTVVESETKPTGQHASYVGPFNTESAAAEYKKREDSIERAVNRRHGGRLF